MTHAERVANSTPMVIFLAVEIWTCLIITAGRTMSTTSVMMFTTPKYNQNERYSMSTKTEVAVSRVKYSLGLRIYPLKSPKAQEGSIEKPPRTDQ